MSTEIYDKDYCEKYVKMADTELGQKIYRSRWRLITNLLSGREEDYTLLDYGCGPGSFHKMAPDGFKAYGYDVNPHTHFNKDIFCEQLDVLTMWDVIEHLHDPLQVIWRKRPEYLFISTPNLESVKCPIKEWKHYRPGEHLYYFDQYSLDALLESAGYKVFYKSFVEGQLRDMENPEAIISVVAKRMESAEFFTYTDDVT